MDTATFTLKLLSIYWITEHHTETDLCAHGQVHVVIGNETIVENTEPDGWAVTAMGLLLLRTLSQNHTKAKPIAEHIIPHCGHSLHFDETSTRPSLEILGCPHGANFWVQHIDEYVQLTTDAGSQVVIPFAEYKKIVLKFTHAVHQFYEQSPPKKLPDDRYERRAYQLLWQEWHSRVTNS